jgi:hypothetical protein
MGTTYGARINCLRLLKGQRARSIKVSHLTLEVWGETNESGMHHPFRPPVPLHGKDMNEIGGGYEM